MNLHATGWQRSLPKPRVNLTRYHVVFGIDIETCPACGEAMRLIVCIEGAEQGALSGLYSRQFSSVHTSTRSYRNCREHGERGRPAGVGQDMKAGMLRAILCSAAARGVGAAQAKAKACKGVSFPDQVQVDGGALKLNGLGLRQATFLNVNTYVAALYVAQTSG